MPYEDGVNEDYHTEENEDTNDATRMTQGKSFFVAGWGATDQRGNK